MKCLSPSTNCGNPAGSGSGQSSKREELVSQSRDLPLTSTSSSPKEDPISAAAALLYGLASSAVQASSPISTTSGSTSNHNNNMSPNNNGSGGMKLLTPTPPTNSSMTYVPDPYGNGGLSYGGWNTTHDHSTPSWGWGFHHSSTEPPMGEWVLDLHQQHIDITDANGNNILSSSSISYSCSPPKTRPGNLQIPKDSSPWGNHSNGPTYLSASPCLLSPVEDGEGDKRADFISKRIRSSSLKTAKTPPSTPAGTKKIVRFADCLGLDLVDVKLFLDEIPNVPKSAFSDLQDAIEQRRTSGGEVGGTCKGQVPNSNKLDRTLLPSFHQPVELGDFMERVNTQKVLLENCYLSDSLQIKGVIRVKNLDFDKRVLLRFTPDDWQTCEEREATYILNSSDGMSDRFEFTFDLDPSKTKVGGKFGFCIKYECLGLEFWDNNCGRNYVFHCVPSS